MASFRGIRPTFAEPSNSRVCAFYKITISLIFFLIQVSRLSCYKNPMLVTKVVQCGHAYKKCINVPETFGFDMLSKRDGELISCLEEEGLA